jgi:hypothetical protein
MDLFHLHHCALINRHFFITSAAASGADEVVITAAEA